jgi:integrase
MGKGTYRIAVYLGTDSNGKRKYYYETIHVKNKKQAQEYLTQKLNDLDKGAFIEPANLTVSEYLDKWAETALKPRVRPKTFDSYMLLIDLYIKPNIGAYKLAKLTPLAIQQMYSTMLGNGLAPRTIRYTHAVLKSALKQAIKWQMLRSNPADNVDLPKQTRQEMNVLTPEQAKCFLEACVYNRWGILFELLLVSGMRPGEALGLKWEDVDWKNNRIHVKRALSRTKEGWRLEEPKTPQSRRTILLPEEVMQDLKEHRRAQAEEKLASSSYTDYGLVFACNNGEPLEERNIVNRFFKPLLKEAGLPDIRLYDLRHTCATLLLAAGENPKVVSERLGHAKITQTLGTYSHVLPTMQEEATRKLGEMLFQK